MRIDDPWTLVPDATGGLLEGARELAEAAAEQAPLDPTHYLRLGQLEQPWSHMSSDQEAKRTHAREAIRQLDQALALAPYHDDARVRQARLGLSVFKGEREQVEHAVAALNPHTHTLPNSPHPHTPQRSNSPLPHTHTLPNSPHPSSPRKHFR